MLRCIELHRDERGHVQRRLRCIPARTFGSEVWKVLSHRCRSDRTSAARAAGSTSTGKAAGGSQPAPHSGVVVSTASARGPTGAGGQRGRDGRAARLQRTVEPGVFRCALLEPARGCGARRGHAGSGHAGDSDGREQRRHLRHICKRILADALLSNGVHHWFGCEIHRGTSASRIPADTGPGAVRHEHTDCRREPHRNRVGPALAMGVEQRCAQVAAGRRLLCVVGVWDADAAHPRRHVRHHPCGILWPTFIILPRWRHTGVRFSAAVCAEHVHRQHLCDRCIATGSLCEPCRNTFA